MRIGVIGAGLNGLAAACLLRKFGHDAQVFERGDAARDSGTGIYVWPQGVQILKFILGNNRLLTEGQPIEYLVTLDRHATELHRHPVRMPGHDFPAPAVMFERKRLFGLLKEGLGNNNIHYGAEAVDINDTDNDIRVTFANGEVKTFDLVIGTDGVFSKVRSYVSDQDCRYTGVAATRGVVHYESPMLEGQSCQIYTHSNARFVTYPLDNSTQFKYWFVAYKHEGDELLTQHELVDRLEGMSSPLLEMIQATKPENIIANKLRAMRAEGPWYKGRCTLLGDSVHGMLPTLGYGFTLGLENCFMLAQAINGNCDDSVESALKRYESRAAVRSQKMLKVMEDMTDLFYFQPENSVQHDSLTPIMDRFYQLAETTVF